jgi:hypothetical protein
VLGFITMLALKLLLVPSFLLALSLVGAQFGPSIAGWLAGLPLVTGPILFVLAMENGNAFAATVGFAIIYSHVSRRGSWPLSLAMGLIAWLACVELLATLPLRPALSLCFAVAALVLAPRFLAAPTPSAGPVQLSKTELFVRMAAGALLTLAVSTAAHSLGSSWSGLLAMFPVLSTVLAVSSHRVGGPAHSSAVLRGLVTGLYAFTAFCIVLAFALKSLPISGAFTVAAAACLVVQVGTRRYLRARLVTR